MSDLSDYFASISSDLAGGRATEHTHRPALKKLLEALGGSGVTATNEPKRVECGAPDFDVARRTTHGLLTIGYAEAKDVGTSLTAAASSEQLMRYRRALPNLLLTDYCDFRWYVEGNLQQEARLCRLAPSGATFDTRGAKDVEVLLTSFLAVKAAPVTSARELAGRLARLARLIHDTAAEAFRLGTESSLLKDLRQAFKSTLIPELSTAAFVDLFAQTLAYALFAARVHHPTGTDFRRDTAAREIPRSSPFLRQLFAAINTPDLDDEPFIRYVDDLVQLLALADMDRVLADFGSRVRGHDPVIHFYETFLTEYDPLLREQRGVYYTPESVVSFIVRSVDEVLKKYLAAAEGLADTERTTWKTITAAGETQAEGPRVLVLDPATGTGTFPYFVIDHIRSAIEAKGNAGIWKGYVRDQLLPRLFGFELLAAPYAIAHIKLSLQLAALDLPATERATWEYVFGAEERINVYLTNTLEPAIAPSHLPFAGFISDEANAASAIKRDLPIMVVIGNPPYSGHSANNGEWILSLLTDYYHADGKPLGEANSKWLRDDYVKFIRFGQWKIESTGQGVLAFITNHRYLRNPTFRGMRQQLLKAFDRIFVLNLHGNKRMREKPPSGGQDENVFDIEQGVAIAIFVRDGSRPDQDAELQHQDLWGKRDEKDTWLFANTLTTVGWQPITATSPNYLFEPRDPSIEAEYRLSWTVDKIFPEHSLGILTKRDSLVIGFTEAELSDRVQAFGNKSLSLAETAETFGLPLKDKDRWDIAKGKFAADAFDRTLLRKVLYRPFDWRWYYHDPTLVARLNNRVLQHLQYPNVALLAGRQGESTGADWDHAWVTATPSDQNVFARGGATVFPLYLYGGEQQDLGFDSRPAGGRVPNLDPAFTQEVGDRLHLTWLIDGSGDCVTSFGPDDLFAYLYAVLFSPAYRARYEEPLGAGFPHVPLTSSVSLFAELVRLGREFIQLHTLDRGSVTSGSVTYPVAGSDIVARAHPRFIPKDPPSQPLGRVSINPDDLGTAALGQYFEGIDDAAWDFHVGGNQPAQRWLADRQQRHLTAADLEHYQFVATAIALTLLRMNEVDAAVDAHGGWPLS
jgi:hypothetical protein